MVWVYYCFLTSTFCCYVYGNRSWFWKTEKYYQIPRKNKEIKLITMEMVRSVYGDCHENKFIFISSWRHFLSDHKAKMSKEKKSRSCSWFLDVELLTRVGSSEHMLTLLITWVWWSACVREFAEKDISFVAWSVRSASWWHIPSHTVLIANQFLAKRLLQFMNTLPTHLI